MEYQFLSIHEKINVRSRFGYNEIEKKYILANIYEVPNCCFDSPNKYYYKK